MSAVSRAEALELLAAEGGELLELVARAGRARLSSRGRAVSLCAIVNARSGGCSQDCAFCSQSSRSTASIERYPLLGADRLVEAAREAARAGARRLGIVTSGRAVRRGPELLTLAEASSRIASELGGELLPCASLGVVSAEVLAALRDAGLSRYHHNLETAESFWPRVCTTRPWSDSVRTVEEARRVGLEVCCGALFGLGESAAERVDLLAALVGLDVVSVPLNFLHPIPGTPLEGLRELSPLDCVRIVAVARLMMPDRELRLCGGREPNLRELGALALLAGADGLMVGNYLTTRGRRVEDDLRLVRDAGLDVEPRPGHREPLP